MCVLLCFSHCNLRCSRTPLYHRWTQNIQSWSLTDTSWKLGLISIKMHNNNLLYLKYIDILIFHDWIGELDLVCTFGHETASGDYPTASWIIFFLIICHNLSNCFTLSPPVSYWQTNMNFEVEFNESVRWLLDHIAWQRN